MTKKNIAGGLLAGGVAGVAAGAVAGVAIKYTYDRHIHDMHLHKKLKSISLPFKKPASSMVKTVYPKRPTSICFSVCF
ncbi:hypothetical protein MSMTP_1665 [Methanosarcina sp. MTP4]|uniref:hypothetical protein n=1 Tax=Methanosarcina sp. MTP4 TaxID=1434100 RepID=UPI0006156006|nr:hypothetical protein [Methanosarcina sp. MTP4]AKB25134.1 hypothetical protein MSMTP_1665 [Methanosarcina sp. MTP4]